MQFSVSELVYIYISKGASAYYRISAIRLSGCSFSGSVVNAFEGKISHNLPENQIKFFLNNLAIRVDPRVKTLLETPPFVSLPVRTVRFLFFT